MFVFNDLLIYATPITNPANPKIKYKSEKYAYLMSNRGLPNVKVEVPEGAATFRLRIKEEVLELKTKRSVDRSNLLKVPSRRSALSMCPVIVGYVLMSLFISIVFLSFPRNLNDISVVHGPTFLLNSRRLSPHSSLCELLFSLFYVKFPHPLPFN